MKDDRPNARSELISFLSKNHFLVRGRGPPPEELTHTLMDGSSGGRICLPDHALDGFMSAYGNDLNNGKKLFVVERRTPVFKMHFDLDLKQLHEPEKTEEILTVLQGAVASFLVGAEGKEAWCIACAVLDPTLTWRKTPGIHVVFPWLFVDTDKALWLRSSVVSKLRQRFPDLESDWETTVDVVVLTTNGLRMVGSDKCRDCPTCRNVRDARDFCPDCSRQGRIPEEKVYWPWKTLPSQETSGLLADVRSNLAYAVRMCSTRVPVDKQRTTACFSVPCGAPPPSVRRKLSAAAARAGGKDHVLGEQDIGSLRLRTELMEITPELRAALQESLANHHPAYEALEVASLERLVGVRHRENFCLKVRGFGCRYCQNRGAEHGQQTIYFILSARGVTQRCYSRKPIVRRTGLCEKYVSPSTCILPALMHLLFPETPLPPETWKGRAASASSDSANAPTKRDRRDSGLALAEKLLGAGRSVLPRVE